jgi:NADPH:quinone reductase-like Zn-dependent oxidoreductase
LNGRLRIVRCNGYLLSTSTLAQELQLKAVVFHKYGPPDVLQLEEVDKPTPKDDEVLIEVHASSVNDWDYQMLRGIPIVNRFMAGLFKPSKIMILGCDVSGRVEAIGKNVAKFKPGDEVLGDISQHRFGGFAEYVCAVNQRSD